MYLLCVDNGVRCRNVNGALQKCHRTQPNHAGDVGIRSPFLLEFQELRRPALQMPNAVEIQKYRDAICHCRERVPKARVRGRAHDGNDVGGHVKVLEQE